MRVESLELWTCNKTLRNLLGSNIRTLAVLNVELKVVVLVNVVVCVAALVFVAFSDVLFGANLAVGIVSKGGRRARNMFTFLVLTETCYGFQD